MLDLPSAAITQPDRDTGLLRSPPCTASPYEVEATPPEVSWGLPCCTEGCLSRRCCAGKSTMAVG